MSFVLDSPAEKAFGRHVVAQLKKFSPEIDVTKFVKAQHWSMQQVMDLYLEVLWDTPEIFYVAKNAECDWRRHINGSIAAVLLKNIQYAFGPEDYQRNKQILDAEVKKAVMYAAKESAPEMIALRLHDYIVRNCEYDTVAADEDDASPLARTVYSVLVRKKAVCEGYTMAYRYLLNKFNIRSEDIVSDEMCHCWNYVCIRNKWYHVDVTYDDPIFYDEFGKLLTQGMNFLAGNSTVSRENFLMSDAKARQTEHYGWELKGLPAATDKTFDNMNWA